MPKLAEQRYDDFYYGSSYNIDNVRYIDRYTRKKNRTQTHKKRNYLGFLIGCGVLAFTLFSVMPFSFNKITKAIFTPTPYKHIQTDMKKLVLTTQSFCL